jgi:hypothetical protein
VSISIAKARHSNIALRNVVEWVAIAALLAAMALLSQRTSYEVVVRFILAAGAMMMMLQTFHAKHYALAAVFGAFALFSNPIAPMFSFSDDWQRAVAVISAVPLVASLAWRNARMEKE